ncbi:hypothetical protein B7H17_03180 [Pseudomonas putida]|uniref:Uncharacterized protein n=1 Tax=Pseudomonas putida TaxID=303 RepID=A0A1X1A5Z4_PSEPU|nr:hypothetical protein B7H17_03180 [Pseudomonas putida]
MYGRHGKGERVGSMLFTFCCRSGSGRDERLYQAWQGLDVEGGAWGLGWTGVMIVGAVLLRL